MIKSSPTNHEIYNSVPFISKCSQTRLPSFCISSGAAADVHRLGKKSTILDYSRVRTKYNRWFIIINILSGNILGLTCTASGSCARCDVRNERIEPLAVVGISNIASVKLLTTDESLDRMTLLFSCGVAVRCCGDEWPAAAASMRSMYSLIDGVGIEPRMTNDDSSSESTDMSMLTKRFERCYN